MSNFEEIDNDDHLFPILADSDGEECPSDKFCFQANVADPHFPEFVDLSGCVDSLMDSAVPLIHPMSGGQPVFVIKLILQIRTLILLICPVCRTVNSLTPSWTH